MGTKERRDREKQIIRDKILAAAQSIITAEGFNNLSMRKLAASIEYSPAAIYLHFRNRDQIAQELTLRGYSLLFERLNQANQTIDLVARIKAVLQAYIAFGFDYPETYRLIFMGDSDYMAVAFGDKSPDNPANRSLQMFVELAVALKEAKHYRCESTAIQLAEMMWSAIHGVVSLRLTCSAFHSSSHTDLANLLIDTLTSGLLKSD